MLEARDYAGMTLKRAYTHPWVPLLIIGAGVKTRYLGRFSRPHQFKWVYEQSELAPIVTAAVNSVAAWMRIETRRALDDGQRMFVVEGVDPAVQIDLWRCWGVYRRCNDSTFWIGREDQRPAARDAPWDGLLRLPGAAGGDGVDVAD